MCTYVYMYSCRRPIYMASGVYLYTQVKCVWKMNMIMSSEKASGSKKNH